MNNMPKEIEEYFKNGTRKIINVIANDDYSLTVTFDNNEVKKYDMKDKLSGVFEILKDRNKFKEVFIDENGNIAWDKDKSLDSNIYWNNRIDLCKDSVYIYSTPIEKPTVIKLKVQETYTLLLRFSNGKDRILDMSYLLMKPKFENFKNYRLFETAKVENGCVVWDNDISMSSDELYEKSNPLSINQIIRLFTNKKVTLARASELAEMPIGEFVEILRNRSIPWGEYTEEDKKVDDTTIEKIINQSSFWIKNSKPRDINRIDAFLNKLGEYWKSCPDLRFGQIMSILDNEAKKRNKDPFNLEENIWEEILETLINRYKK